MTVKNNVQVERKNLGLRQEDLAAQVSVSRQTIISIENGKYSPSLELAIKISQVLGKRVEELFWLE